MTDIRISYICFFLRVKMNRWFMKVFTKCRGTDAVVGITEEIINEENQDSLYDGSGNGFG